MPYNTSSFWRENLGDLGLVQGRSGDFFKAAEADIFDARRPLPGASDAGAGAGAGAGPGARPVPIPSFSDPGEASHGNPWVSSVPRALNFSSHVPLAPVTIYYAGLRATATCFAGCVAHSMREDQRCFRGLEAQTSENLSLPRQVSSSQKLTELASAGAGGAPGLRGWRRARRRDRHCWHTALGGGEH